MPKRILKGVVVSDKADKTITVLVERRFTDPLFKKTVRSSKKYMTHDEGNKFKVGDLVIKEGDTITIDGGSGRVMQGVVPTVKPDISGYFSTLEELHH